MALREEYVMKKLLPVLAGLLLLALPLVAQDPVKVDSKQAATMGREPYLRWNAKQAEKLGISTYAKGKVKGGGGRGLLQTDRAKNYKLRATWMTPDVIRASARIIQLREGLTDAETRALVEEAESIEGTVVMVELDANEGSGVIPSSWIAFLHAKGTEPGSDRSVGGVKQGLRKVRVLAGVRRRKYAYTRFWIVFPFVTRKGGPLFPAMAREAEIVVRIDRQEGRARWHIPDSIREKVAASF